MASITKQVLAENLFREYVANTMHWADQSPLEQAKWVRVAELVLNREARLTYVAGHKAAVNRQLNRIKERHKCNKIPPNG